jgi:SRSO17 transposase
LHELAPDEHAAGILRCHRFWMNRPLPARPQQLGDPAGTFPISLHRHRRKRRLPVSRLQQNSVSASGNKTCRLPL